MDYLVQYMVYLVQYIWYIWYSIYGIFGTDCQSKGLKLKKVNYGNQQKHKHSIKLAMDVYRHFSKGQLHMVYLVQYISIFHWIRFNVTSGVTGCN